MIKENMEWIKIDEKHPKDEQACLVFDKNDGILTAYFRKDSIHHSWGGKCCCFKDIENPLYVTHWMPLPEAPNDIKV